MKKSNHPRGRLPHKAVKPSPKARKKISAGDDVSTGELRLAAKIRAVYISARSAWELSRRGADAVYVCPKSYDKEVRPATVDGVAVEGGKVQPPVWVRLARKFASLCLDPDDYVFTAFEHSMGHRPPEPGQLLDRKLLVMYEQARAGEHANLVVALGLQKHTAAVNVAYRQSYGADFVDSHVRVLCDLSLSLSSLFRFCLAYSLVDRSPKFASLASSFAVAAACQYHRSKEAYDSAWGGFIPAEFVARSRQFYERAINGDDVTGGWSDDDDEEKD